MKVQDFAKLLAASGVEFMSGVPDSTLPRIGEAAVEAGIEHVLASNEGAAVALAGGARAAGAVSAVYLQNTGLGVAVDAWGSLVGPDVLRLPLLWVVGWRGCPWDPDVPAHRWHGEMTPALCELAGLRTVEWTGQPEHDRGSVAASVAKLSDGIATALLVRRGQLVGDRPSAEGVRDLWDRPAAVEALCDTLGSGDRVVAGVGYVARELARVRRHADDILATGGMGHAAAFAFGLAQRDRSRRVVSLQGDASAAMHLGTWLTLTHRPLDNYVTVLVDNGCHESVGGPHSPLHRTDVAALAKAAGFSEVFVARTAAELRDAWGRPQRGARFIHLPICVTQGPAPARPPTRPSTTQPLSRVGPRLFCPGPGPMSAPVRRAVALERGSRTPDAQEATDFVRERVLRCFGAEPSSHACVPLAGSATTALDAAMHLASSRVVVISNGVYGRRLASLARGAGRPVEHRAFEGALSAHNVDEALQDARPGDWVALVHGETSHGRLNPAHKVTAVARERGLRVLLDATGTLGVEPVDVAGWGVDVAVGSSAKGLEGPAGLGLVVAAHARLQAATAAPLSLDLGAQHRRFEHDGQFRFTPPTLVLQGLCAALRVLDQEGGVPARGMRYRKLAQRLCEGLKPLGIRPLVDAKDRMALILVFEASSPAAALRQRLHQAGIEIYADADGHPRRFRLGLVGVGPADVEHLIGAIVHN